MSGTDTDLYDTDFFAWTQRQAEAVRTGVWDDIDRDHLAEEIADGWKRDSENRKSKALFKPRADTGQPVMSARGRVPRARRRALGARRREMSAAGPKGDHLFSTQIVSYGIPSVLLTRDHAPAFPW
jgi:hypothetical protein